MLYIANATKQHRVFFFRSPEVRRPQRLDIPSGRQVALGSRWTASEVEHVVRQLDGLGAKRVQDVRNTHLDHFHGLIYSFDKVVKEDDIQAGHEAVVDHQHRRAAAEVAKGAAAVDLKLRDGRTGKRRAKATGVSIKQDLPNGVKPSPDDINTDISIEEDGTPLELPE